MTSLNLYLMLLCTGDLVASLTLSASMRKNQPKLIDITTATTRFFAAALAVVLSRDESKARILAAIIILLSVPFSYMDIAGSSDDHTKLAFILAVCFGACEAFLILLNRTLAARRKFTKKQEELQERLLQGDAEAGVDDDSVGEDDDGAFVPEDDKFKGQGATFRRLISLAYPERYILAVASLALFISSAATVVTPAVS